MKIAQIANITEAVPPKKYGGTERVIYALTEELVKLGHDVTLFASGDSRTSAKLVSVVPKALGNTEGLDPYGPNTLTALHYGLAYQMQDQFEIIHDHLDNISMPVANLSNTPVVRTLHYMFTEEAQQLYTILNKSYVVTISHKQHEMGPRGLNHVGTIHHGLSMEHYPFSSTNDGYLLFVGRISHDKGVHTAIEVAESLGLPLVIAAKLHTHHKNDLEYFEEYVKPKLSDRIRWVGEVDEVERNQLMSKALCFLHPGVWPEPFGLTLIESLGCGVPVIAFNHGSIPEIIVDGETGFVVETVDQMVDAVRKIGSISRRYCREYALKYFCARRMAEDYVRIYERILEKRKYPFIQKPDMGNLFDKVMNHPYTASRKIAAYAHDIKRDLKMSSPKPNLALDLDD